MGFGKNLPKDTRITSQPTQHNNGFSQLLIASNTSGSDQDTNKFAQGAQMMPGASSRTPHYMLLLLRRETLGVRAPTPTMLCERGLAARYC